MAASARLLADRRANGLCPLDGKPAAPFVYCEHHRQERTKATTRSQARRAVEPKTGKELDELLRHARKHGEAVLYTPATADEGVGFELVREEAPLP